jgi:hypothetical protein
MDDLDKIYNLINNLILVEKRKIKLKSLNLQ